MIRAVADSNAAGPLRAGIELPAATYGVSFVRWGRTRRVKALITSGVFRKGWVAAVASEVSGNVNTVVGQVVSWKHPSYGWACRPDAERKDAHIFIHINHT